MKARAFVPWTLSIALGACMPPASAPAPPSAGADPCAHARAATAEARTLVQHGRLLRARRTLTQAAPSSCASLTRETADLDRVITEALAQPALTPDAAILSATAHRARGDDAEAQRTLDRALAAAEANAGAAAVIELSPAAFGLEPPKWFKNGHLAFAGMHHVYVVDPDTRAIAGPFDDADIPRPLAVSPDGRMLWTRSFREGMKERAALWDIERGGEPRAVVQDLGSASPALVGEDGSAAIETKFEDGKPGIVLVDATTGRVRRVAPASRGIGVSHMVAARGVLAVAWDDGSLALYDADTGALAQALAAADPARPRGIAAHPDGGALAWIDKGGVELLELPSRKRLSLRDQAKCDPSAVAFDRKRARIAVGTTDGGACLWELEPARRLRRVTPPPSAATAATAATPSPFAMSSAGPVTSIAFAEDGVHLLVSSGFPAHAIGIATGELDPSAPEGLGLPRSVRPDGQVWASYDEGGQIVLSESSSGMPVKTLLADAPGRTSVAFAGTSFVVAGEGRFAWLDAKGTVTDEMSLAAWTPVLADGPFLIDAAKRSIRVRGRKEPIVIPEQARLSLRADGAVLAIGTHASLEIRDLGAEVTHRYPLDASKLAWCGDALLAVLPTGMTLIQASAMHLLPVGGRDTAFACSADRLVAEPGASSPLVIELPSGRALRRLKNAVGTRPIAVHGTRAILRGKETGVWDLTSGERAFSLPGGASGYSPDGALVIGAIENAAAVWDASTGALRMRVVSLPGAVVAIANDGRAEVQGDRNRAAAALRCHLGARLFPFELCEDARVDVGIFAAGLAR